jgi:hypothetical protein
MLGARKEEKAQKVEITNAAVIVHQLDSLLSKDK